MMVYRISLERIAQFVNNGEMIKCVDINNLQSHTLTHTLHKNVTYVYTCAPQQGKFPCTGLSAAQENGSLGFNSFT